MNAEPTLELTMDAQHRYALARNVAEQSGIFAAIEFDKANPDIHTFLFNEWKRKEDKP